ncbi:MAG TPA: hypothetical protein VN368_02170 [Candidatus Methylomirabilis sp.]|nr:hypothetical protein [Candidatus Methylomirabilis sp.]
MNSNCTYEEKKRFVLESGLTINELRQILHELKEDEAKSKADNMTIMDYIFIQKKLGVRA